MTLRHLHPFEPDAEGDCYRCEFPADESEVHVPAGETIVGYLDPSGKGRGNWVAVEPRFTSFSEDDWEGGAA